MEQDLEVLVTELVESATVLRSYLLGPLKFGVGVEKTHVTKTIPNRFYVSDNVRYQTPGLLEVEGDWSMQPFGLLQAPLAPAREVMDLNMQRKQGDRTILAALSLLSACFSPRKYCCGHVRSSPSHSANVADTPDLVPPLAIVAGLCGRYIEIQWRSKGCA